MSTSPSASKVGQTVGRLFSTVAGCQGCHTARNTGRHPGVGHYNNGMQVNQCALEARYTAVWKEQKTSSDMQPFMAEEKDMRISRYLDKTQKYIERKQRQRIISRKL